MHVRRATLRDKLGREGDDVCSQLNYSRGGKRMAGEGGKEGGEDDISWEGGEEDDVCSNS